MKLTVQLLFFFAISIASLQGQNFSLNFDGNDDFVIFPNCEAMTSPSFTIEGWFKCQGSADPQVILMSFLDIPDKNANITLEVRPTGALRFNLRPVATILGGEDMYSTTAVNNNVWHHFAAVKEGSDRLWLYIDGFPEVVTCGFYEPINVVPLFEMGRNRYEDGANYRAFKGNIDDFKIWNRAKNCREIFNDFKSESLGLESGLYSNYKFDINLDTVYDCSNFKRHGTREGVFGLNNLPQYSPDIPPLADKLCEVQLVGVDDGLLNPGGDGLAVISPNPVSNILEVELKGIQNIHGQIYASDGRLVREIRLVDKGNNIDVSDLPSGVYLIKLGNSKIAKTQRFIKT